MEYSSMETADYLQSIAAELERLRVLKEYELGVRVEEGAHGPYVYDPSDAETGEAEE